MSKTHLKPFMSTKELARRMFEQQELAGVLGRSLRQLRKAALRNGDDGSNPDRCIYSQACAKIAQAEAALTAARSEERRLLAISTAGASARPPMASRAAVGQPSGRQKKRQKMQLKHVF
jgi:hypothetical protein